MEIKLFKLLDTSNVDLKEVKALIAEGVDINCVNEEGSTPFLYLMKGCSTKTNLQETMQFLIDNNFDVNSNDIHGCTSRWNALQFVCKLYGKEDLIDLIQMLVQHGIVVNATDNEGHNALHFVCDYYKKDNINAIIAILIDNGIDVNSYTKNKWNALHMACCNYQRENLIDVVQLLIERGIDVNLKNNFGEIALQTLCRNYRYGKWIGIIRMLIQSGTDVNHRNNQGWNALHIICKARYQEPNLIEEIQLLIDHGIDVNHTTKEGNALHLLCKYYPNENIIDIFQLLISNGIVVRWNGVDPRILLRQNRKQENNSSVLQYLNRYL